MKRRRLNNGETSVVVFSKFDKDERQRRKEDVNHRQGRTHETRDRVAKQKILIEQALKEAQVLFNCKYCEGYIVTDKTSGSSYCEDCGWQCKATAFFDTKGTKEQLAYSPKNRRVQLYDPETHFAQTTSATMANDPRIKEQDIITIARYLNHEQNTDVTGLVPSYMGPRVIKEAVLQCKLQPTYASHWIQICSRIDSNFPVLDISQDMRERLKLRYRCVKEAFEKVIKTKSDTECNKKGNLNRRNMPNLNYTIPQMMRIESEQLFRENAQFFPQGMSEQQPELNNLRWKSIIAYCKENCSRTYSYETKRTSFEYKFEWEYIPLTTKDIFLYFLKFR